MLKQFGGYAAIIAVAVIAILLYGKSERDKQKAEDRVYWTEVLKNSPILRDTVHQFDTIPPQPSVSKHLISERIRTHPDAISDPCGDIIDSMAFLLTPYAIEYRDSSGWSLWAEAKPAESAIEFTYSPGTRRREREIITLTKTVTLPASERGFWLMGGAGYSFDANKNAVISAGIGYRSFGIAFVRGFNFNALSLTFTYDL